MLMFESVVCGIGNGRDCVRHPHQRRPVLLGGHPGSSRERSVCIMGHGLVDCLQVPGDSCRTHMVKVQSVRPGGGDNRHHVWVRQPDLHHRHRRYLLRSDGRQNHRHLRGITGLTRIGEFFWGPFASLSQQHFDCPPFARCGVFRYCRLGESSNPSTGSIRFRQVLRWDGDRWSRMERPGFSCIP